jgi:hypothetical protein
MLWQRHNTGERRAGVNNLTATLFPNQVQFAETAYEVNLASSSTRMLHLSAQSNLAKWYEKKDHYCFLMCSVFIEAYA